MDLAALKTLVAVVQFKSSTDKQENLSRTISYIEQAAARKADLICFPEFHMAFSPAGQSPSELARIAESIDGNFVTALRQAAKKYKIGVVSAIYEKAKNSRVFDTAIVISKTGKLVSVYRKLHLYDALGFKESRKLMPGKAIEKPVRTASGNIGLLICYDLRFPELSRLLAIDGANILVAPSGWVQGPMKEEHWLTMVKARAIENGSYVVAPDQVGNIYAGRSMVVDPFGKTLLDMGQDEGMQVVELDMDNVKQVRKSLPLLKNRRTDVYDLKVRDL